MKSLIRFSMNNGVALLLIVAILIGGGAYAMNQMKMEKYPAVDIPYLTVQIVYPGASPSQVMDTFGQQLEAELNRLDRLENLYVTAGANYFAATLGFEMGIDMEVAEANARAAVGKVEMPSSVKNINYYKDQLEGDVYSIAISGSDTDSLQTYIRDRLLPAYRAIDGIERLDASGLIDERAVVTLREADMGAHGIDATLAKAAIVSAQLSVPIGSWRTEAELLPVRVGDTIGSLEELRGVLMWTAQGPVTLSEVADIAYARDDDQRVRLNGQPAIILSVVGKGGYDTVRLVSELEAAEAAAPVPDGLSKQLLVKRTEEIQRSVNSMLQEVLLGACMAMLVTLLFLRNLRSTLIAIISIPLSMFASMLVLNQLGYTLNIMTLAGIAVAIGRVVDDSIVVIENVFRRVRMTERRDDRLVEDATSEVSRAITSSTLTTVAVFLPLAFVPGIVGAFFRPLAWTIVISLLFSLLVAITVVPLLSRLSLLKVKHRKHAESGLQSFYRRMLEWSLSHRLVTLLLAFLLLLGSLAVLASGSLGFNFLPSEPSRKFTVEVSMAEGANVQATDKIVSQIEAAIHQHPVKYVAANIRNASASVSFRVDDQVHDTDALAQELREQFKRIDGAKTITLAGEAAIGGTNGLIITVNGPDDQSILQAGDQMVEVLKGITGLEDIRHTGQGEKPEVRFVTEDRKFAEVGLNNGLIAQAMNRVLQGETLTSAVLDGRSTDIVLREGAAPESSAPIGVLNDIVVQNVLGQSVRLGDVGSWERVLGPSSIQRLNQKQYVQLRGTITDANTGGVTATVESKLNGLRLPDGITWEAVGASKEMNEGFASMGIALGISVFLVYLVMLLAFGEWLTPFVILFSIPFSLIGALGGLWLVGEPVGMPALIGLLMLNGIVVTNAIVLLERVRGNLRQGMERDTSLLEAGVTRLRPILMTAIATIGALFPLSLSSDVGLVSRSLAVVVIGGLATSTLLTLIIVPVIFSLLHRRKVVTLEASLDR